jgi:hypothetical protein
MLYLLCTIVLAITILGILVISEIIFSLIKYHPGRIYNIIFMIVIFSIIISVYLAPNLSDYFSLNDKHKDKGISQTIYYDLSFDNSSKNYILSLCPFSYGRDRPIKGADVTIKNDFFISTSTTNALGFSSLIIQPEDLQNITGWTIYGKLEHDDYYNIYFEFILYNNMSNGTFTITNKARSN